MNSREDFIQALLWMLVLLFSILIHEFGHALTARKFSGRQPHIRLWAMGGLAYPNASLTKKQTLYMVLAGPGAGLTFFLCIILYCVARYGLVDGLDVIIFIVTRSQDLLLGSGAAFFDMHNVTFALLRGLIMFNFWWSLVNLLPVYPLDGGQAYATFQPSLLKVYKVGLYTGIVTALIGFLIFNSFFVAILFGFLAFQNYQRIQQINGSGGPSWR